MESRKAGFVTYVGERLAGYEPRATAPRGEPVGGVERGHGFPGVLRGGIPDGAGASIGTPTSLACTGPIAYKGQEALQRDTENVKAALKGVNAEEAFMPPGPRMSRRSVSKNEVLSYGGGIPLRDRRCHARGVQRHRHRGIPTAGRRSTAGDLLQLESRLDRRAMPQMGGVACRGAELRAERHPAGESAFSHLLRHQYRSPRP